MKRSASPPMRPRNGRSLPGVALQLFSLGIPCIYYGTEQSFAGPENRGAIDSCRTSRPIRHRSLSARDDVGGSIPAARDTQVSAGRSGARHGLPASGRWHGGPHCFDPGAPPTSHCRPERGAAEFPVLTQRSAVSATISNSAAVRPSPALASSSHGPASRRRRGALHC